MGNKMEVTMLEAMLTLLTGVLTGPKARESLEQVISSFLDNPRTGGVASLLKRFQDQGRIRRNYLVLDQHRTESTHE